MDNIATAYDHWSMTYDAQENETRDLDELVLRRIVPDLSGRTVVECGCGTGKNSSWLAPRCGRLIGIDFSSGMLGIARSKLEGSRALFLLHDLRLPWPLSDGSADLVLFNLVLEHIEDLTPVFGHSARVLRKGGQMALSEYHPDRVVQGKGPVIAARDGTAARRIPNYLHTLEDYLGAAEAAGLQPISRAEWSPAELRGPAAAAPEDRDIRPQLISLVFEKTDS